MTGHGNNTWLLDGPEPAIVDAGVGVPAHVDAIAEALAGRALHRVLLTHGHADHASGAPALRARWPAVKVFKFSPDGVDQCPLADGDLIPAGDRALTVLHTPGHSLDHVCFWDPSARDLFAGDMVTLGTTVMIPAGRGGGLRAYLNSLQRMAALGPVRILPGHGAIVERPLEIIDQYLAHRRMREAQVRDCLEAGLLDTEAIVKRIYPDLPAALTTAARATIEAHIEKLREDGTWKPSSGN